MTIIIGAVVAIPVYRVNYFDLSLSLCLPLPHSEKLNKMKLKRYKSISTVCSCWEDKQILFCYSFSFRYCCVYSNELVCSNTNTNFLLVELK